MSTKTLRKRIALVAVSALGFGLLSVIPSSAVVGTIDNADEARSISSVTVPLVRVGDTKAVTVKLAYGTTGVDSFTAGVDTAIVGSVVRARVMSGPTAGTVGTTVVSSGNISDSLRETTTVSSMGTYSPTFNITPTVAGTYTLLVWVDESGVAGNDTVPLVTDRQTTVSFTTAGTPATVSLTSAAKSGKSGVATPTSFGFTLKDAAGNNTYLLAGETLSGSVADVTANATGATLYLANGDTTTVTSDTFTAGINRSITVDSLTAEGSISVAASLAGITRATIVGSGLLTGVVPAVTADLTTVAYGFATKFELTTTTGVITTGAVTTAAPATTRVAALTAAGTGLITASNASALSLSFKVTTGSTPSTVQYTIAARTGVTLPTGVTAGTYTAATTGDSSTATIAIAATSALATTGYDISVAVSATTTMKYSVTYAAPTVSDTNGYVTVAPTTANAAKTLIGGSASVTATVRDQFGAVFSGANVIWTVTGRNASTSAGVTNASGVATLTITDAALATSTTVSDVVTATAAAPTATAYTVSTNNSSSAVTSFAYVASMTVGTLTLTNSQATAAALAAGTDTEALLDETETLTATATSAAGVLMSGIPVTFTLPAGAYVAAGTLLTVYTNTSGVAVLTGVGGTITGATTASATAGGATASTSWRTKNSSTDGRTITIDNATMSVSGSSAGQAIVTVRDRYGNLVGGAGVSLTYIGNAGRVAAVNGVIASEGTTGATTGTARIDLTAGSTEAGTGTLTVTLKTVSDTSTATTMGNGAAYTVRVASVTSAVTVGATKSAEVIAIEAVAAKAAADKAESDAKIALLQAALDAAATKAAADKLALEAAIAASQAASVAAAEAAADAAAEAIDAGNNAFDAATSAGEAADAATAAAEQAGEDATAAATAAGEAAVAAAEAAQEAAAEATDAANAATDAANASAEAADAATAAAQDAADAVAALSVQVTEVIATLKKQITALTNLVIRIQKKVKA
jgi:trimeric autotransporter adhesin